MRVLAHTPIGWAIHQMVAHSMIDLGVMHVDANAGLDRSLADNVIHPQWVEIAA
jgi:hypothetical protein